MGFYTSVKLCGTQPVLCTIIIYLQIKGIDEPMLHTLNLKFACCVASSGSQPRRGKHLKIGLEVLHREFWYTCFKDSWTPMVLCITQALTCSTSCQNGVSSKQDGFADLSSAHFEWWHEPSAPPSSAAKDLTNALEPEEGGEQVLRPCPQVVILTPFADDFYWMNIDFSLYFCTATQARNTLG